VKQLLIPIYFLLLSSPVIADNHKGETLYGWWKNTWYEWMEFGDKDHHAEYRGNVKNGKPNGIGIVSYPDENKYIGEWKDGKYHGQGTYTFDNGIKYVGEFKDGEEIGQGTETFPDGSKYVGNSKDGDEWNLTFHDKDGNVILKLVNGNGQGTFTYPYGEKYDGEWKDGGLWNGTGYSKNGNITYKYDDGRMDKTINPLKTNQ
jgi:hypothetical protein